MAFGERPGGTPTPPKRLRLLLALAVQITLLCPTLAAAQSSACPSEGSAALALTSATDAADAHATCFARFHLKVDAACRLWVVPTAAAAGWSYSAVWSPVPLQETNQQACPTAALPGGLLPAHTAAGVAAAIRVALSAALFPGAVSGVATTTSGLSLTIQASRNTTLEYAVVEGFLGAVVTPGTPAACTAAGAPCAYSSSSGCGAGRHVVAAGGSRLCIMCRPGAACAGGDAAPKPCTSGTSAGFGAATCTPCSPGSFAASAGQSQCTLVPPGSYQHLAGQSGYLPCPAPSDSLLPGASACLACYFGKPVVYAGAGGLHPNNVPAEQPSSGFLMAALPPSSPLYDTAACGFNPFTSVCSSLGGRTLALAVDASCWVTVYVLGDLGCSQESNLPRMRGVFTDASTIQAALPSSPGTSVSLRLAITGASALEASFFEFTTKFDRPAGSLRTCSATLALADDRCPAGTSRESNPQGSVPVFRASGCAPCSVGNRCDGSTPLACSPGTYSALVGASSCIACPVHTVSSAGGAACERCSAGTAPSASGDVCQLCPEGQVTAGEGSTQCRPCPAGTYRAPFGMECYECPPGAHSAEGAAACSLCQPGTSAASIGTPTDPGTSSCPACPPGQFSDGEGSHDCHDCPAGTFSSSPGAAACSPCPPGQITSTDGGTAGATQCTPCPRGTYTQGEENRCHSCPSGYETGVNGTGAAACTPCRPGFASSLPNSPLCTPCAPASFAPQTGARRCQLCSGGFATGLAPTETGQTGRTATGGSRCDPCPPRTFRPSMVASNQCTTCPIGRETRVPFAATSCIACSPGNTLANATAVTCTACPSGTHSPTPGAMGACKPCPGGSYSPDSGNSICDLCEPGTYQALPGQAACTPCPEGTFTAAVGSALVSACQACPKGAYAAGPGNDACLTCDRGTYQDKTGQGFCKDCLPGHGCPAGATVPKPCSAGFYSAGREPFCKPCAAGTFSPTPRQRACRPCPAGSYCPSTGLPAAVPCPAGTFGNKFSSVSASECRRCPINTFSASPGSQKCVNCNPGQWTGRLLGQKLCWPSAFRLPLTTAKSKSG